VKREALVRALRRYAARQNLPFRLDKAGGKGSHYRLRLGDAVTTLQSGELTPLLVNRICKQLGVDPAAL
jgi:hypothetical protein